MTPEAAKILGQKRAERARAEALAKGSTGPKEHTGRGRPVHFAEVAAHARKSCKFCGGSGQKVVRRQPTRTDVEKFTVKGKEQKRTTVVSLPIVGAVIADAKACGCAVSRFLKKNSARTILGGDEQLFWREGLEPPLPSGVQVPGVNVPAEPRPEP